MSDDVISVTLRLRDGALFAAETRKASREIDHLGDSARKADRDAKGLSTSFELVNKTANLLKWPAIIAGIGLLGQAFSAATAGGIGFIAALSPLVGLLGTLPALAVLAGQGFGVTKIGLMGVTDALGGLNEAIDPKKFALLQRPAQDFVLALDKMKQPVLALQRSLQAGLFPGLTAGLHAAMPAVKALTGPLTGTARVIGLFADRLGHLVGSRGFLKDLRSQAYFNNIQMTRMGGAVLHLVNVFRNLMVASRPLVATIVRMVAGWAATADRATAAGRASGGLQRAFHSVWVTTSRVLRTLIDFAVGLFNIGRISKREIGDGLLVHLTRSADQFRRWTASGPGIARITKFFADARPVVAALGTLLKDTATQILRFGAGSTGGLVGTLGVFDRFVRIVGTLSRLVGPDTVVYAFLAGKVLAGGLGALNGFAGGMRAIAVATGLATTAGAAELGIIEATQAAATGMWLAITGPEVLVVAGVLAVAAAFYLAYTKIGWFHTAVDSVFGFITGHWPLLLAILTGPFGLATLFIYSHFNALVGFFRRLPGRIWNALKSVPGLIGKAFHGILGLPGKALNTITGVLGGRAAGGPIMQTGTYLVGERGPEMVTLHAGSYVVPNERLTPMAAPVSATVAGSSGPRRASAPVVIDLHSVLQLPDGRIVADTTDQVIGVDQARA